MMVMMLMITIIDSVLMVTTMVVVMISTIMVTTMIDAEKAHHVDCGVFRGVLGWASGNLNQHC